jgi:hypothetical protein
MAAAIKTCLQKIADPADLAPTAGVAFANNHIAAAGQAALPGLVRGISLAAVFLTGAILGFGSLLLARLVPGSPEPGFEVMLPPGGRPATRSVFLPVCCAAARRVCDPPEASVNKF